MIRGILALALSVALLAPAAAQDQDAPLVAVPPGASYSGQSLSFSGTSLSFSTTSFSFSASSISMSSAPVDASRMPVGMAGSPVTQGMSVKEEKGGALRFTLNADLLFDFDKANLRPAADEVLRSLVAQVDQRLPNGRFRIEGHTDAKGNDKYNDALSLRRAKSVEAWLTKNASIAPRRIATSSFGKRRPVAPNTKPDGSDDPEGRQKNRRVEILILP
jgi:outer membrane protein OmpA-like peptidoglycan-associated protein